MKGKRMPVTLRFTKTEEAELNKKCTEINKILINQNQMPMRVSELAHKILEITIRYVKVDKNGNIYIDS